MYLDILKNDKHEENVYELQILSNFYTILTDICMLSK